MSKITLSQIVETARAIVGDSNVDTALAANYMGANDFTSPHDAFEVKVGNYTLVGDDSHLPNEMEAPEGSWGAYWQDDTSEFLLQVGDDIIFDSLEQFAEVVRRGPPTV